MADSSQGLPCWFELSTSNLDAAEPFYAAVLGWTIQDSGMPDMTYHLAGTPKGMVAGLMPLMPELGDMPPNWLVYVAVDNLDDATGYVTDNGGNIVVVPTEIPGTGRFAIITDPLGAALGLLEPLPPEEPPEAMAFDPAAPGHCSWIELLTPDIDVALGFYGPLFGWKAGESMPMGAEGHYQIIERNGEGIGGMTGLGDAPASAWMPYFGAHGVETAIERITEAGGAVHHGPVEIPGGMNMAVITDPQGAFFAVIGPLKS